MDYPEEFQREVKLEFYRAGVQVVREIGFTAVKTLITLNSGAFVVLLTFIGNTAAQSQFVVPLTNLKLAMFCFLFGLAAIFLSIVQTYISARRASPYNDQNEVRSEGWLTFLSIIFPALSFFSFLVGVSVVICGVKLA